MMKERYACPLVLTATPTFIRGRFLVIGQCGKHWPVWLDWYCSSRRPRNRSARRRRERYSRSADTLWPVRLASDDARRRTNISCTTADCSDSCRFPIGWIHSLVGVWSDFREHRGVQRSAACCRGVPDRNGRHRWNNWTESHRRRCRSFVDQRRQLKDQTADKIPHESFTIVLLCLVFWACSTVECSTWTRYTVILIIVWSRQCKSLKMYSILFRVNYILAKNKFLCRRHHRHTVIFIRSLRGALP